MRAAGFDLRAILSAQPDPANYGYGPGPWPIQVRDFVPPSAAAAQAAGERNPDFSFEQNHEPPRTQRIVVSRKWSGVCMLELEEGSNIMCGQIIRSASYNLSHAFWRHMRRVHTGAYTMPANGYRIRAAEVLHHDLLQRQFVLTGQWREARFRNEPGRGPPGYELTRIADEFEQLAAVDSQFAAIFGTKFHRRNPDCTDPEPQETGIDLLLRAAAALESTE